MRCLGGGDEVDAVVDEAAGFGGRQPIVNKGMRCGVTDLLGRGIGGDNAVDMRRQSQRRLAAAGGAIPGEFSFGAQAGKPGEQRGGIVGTIGGVAVGRRREVILERVQAGSSVRRRSLPICRTSLNLNRAASASALSAGCENSPRASSPTAIGAT